MTVSDLTDGRSDGQQPVAAAVAASVLFSGQFGIIDSCAPLVTGVTGCSAAAVSPQRSKR